MKVSIVMTSYLRSTQLERTLPAIFAQNYPELEVILIEDGDDGGKTRAVCEKYPILYGQRADRPEIAWANPAPILNRALNMATGEAIIMQNPECLHVGEVIRSLVSRVAPKKTVFATCEALDENDKHLHWYVHPEYARRPAYHCGIILAQDCVRYDEEFTTYGMEDLWFADCLRMNGVEFEYAGDIMVHHLWHPQHTGSSFMRTIYRRKRIEHGLDPDGGVL